MTTPLYAKLGLDADARDAAAENIRCQVPVGRFGEPREVAATVRHLASSESAFIVGTEIIVEGAVSQP